MKKALFIFMALSLYVSMTFAQWDGTSAPWTQGSGTQSDPYLIENAQHLAYLSDMVSGGVSDYEDTYFLLTTDINLNQLTFFPIGGDDGSTDHPFKGHFNGGGHTVRGLRFFNVTYHHIGLFGTVENGSIRNLKCNGQLRLATHGFFNKYVGGICAEATNAVIDNCTYTGIICDTVERSSFYTYTYCIGGIVGNENNSTISRCVNHANIITNNSYTLGGYTTHDGTLRIGGIAGSCTQGGVIRNCYNTGNISATGYFIDIYYNWSYNIDYNNFGPRLSGIANLNIGSGGTPSIINCFNTGNISCTLRDTYDYSQSSNIYYIHHICVAGIMSTVYYFYNGTMLNYDATIKNCYNVGTLSQSAISQICNIYGISHTSTNSYYKTGCGASVGGTPRTEVQMKSVSFPTMLNADSTVFIMDELGDNDGYPIFTWATVYNLATDTVTDVTTYSAKLHGHFSGNPDSCGFVYRVSGSSDSTVVMLANATSPAQAVLTGLLPNTTYSCRFFAQKGNHTLRGSEQTFTTYPTYTVTVQSANSALGTVSGSGTFGYGEIDTITASPVEHYQFTQWSDGNSDNPRYLTVTQSQTLTATFALAQHTVAVTANNTAWGTVSGGGTYNYGQTILLNATPSQGYHFTAWNDGDTVNPRVITVESNLSLTATFAPNQYNVSLYSNNPTKGTVSGGGVYSYGQQTYIIATPLGNYSFSQWSDGNTEAYRLITVTQDIAYTAIFTDATYTITAQSNNEQYGTVTGTGTYVGGSSVTLTATPYTGYNFVQWSDGNTDNPRTVTVTANATYTAQFAPNNYTVTATSADNTMGYVIGGGSYTYMSQITLEATAMPHYHFTQWSDGSTANPRIITVMGDATYTAQFAIDQHTVNVVSTDVSQGTATGGGSYDYGALVTITATAAEHYHFNQWSDGNTSNPRVITVTGDVTYSASFAPDSYTITVISSDNTMGYISGGGSFIYGTQTTIAATALPHHSFVQWNDGVTINPRTVTVTSDSSFTAIFSEEPRYTVTVVSEDPAKGSVTGGGQFYAGEQTVIMASAATNHLFDHWSDGSHDAMHTVIVTSDVTYTAYFSAVTYSVNVYSNDDNLGTVSGGGSFEFGQQATVTATPAAGCRFVRWNNGVETNPYTFTVYGDVNLIATFERNAGIEDVESPYKVIIEGLRIHVVGASNERVRIIDMTGREVYNTQQYNGGIIPLPSAGIYLIRLGENHSQKIVATK